MADFENGLPPITSGSEGNISGVAINKSEYKTSDGLEIRNISLQKSIIDKVEDVVSHIQCITFEKEDIGMNVGGFI